MRKLASIQKISKIERIVGADKLELATILGWKVVVRKGEFKEGDLIVFLEVDSILPERKEFEFLREKKFRVRTITLRGQISQGLAFSTNVLPSNVEIKEGADVTHILGVKKYEPPMPMFLSGEVKGSFPYFIPKSDEVRIQAIPQILERYRGKLFYITEKVDGTSATFYTKNEEFGVCSRNFELKEDDKNLFWRLAKHYNLMKRLPQIGKNIAIQGEVLGPKIQDNKYSLEEPNLFLFSIYDIDDRRYYDYKKFFDFTQTIGLKTVPILNINYILNDTIENLVEFAKGPSILNPKVAREGIVIRCVTEIVDPEFGRVSFKVLNPDFLLKYEL